MTSRFLRTLLFANTSTILCQAMLMLQNPHVVQLEQVLESDDHVFFVMELCGGGNLHEYLDSQVRTAH